MVIAGLSAARVDRRKFLETLGLTGLTAFAGGRVYAGDVEEIQSADLDHPWENGLYSTITAPFVPVDSPSGARKVGVRVKGMKEPMETKAVNLGADSPLVIVINGTSSLAENPFANQWMAWLQQRGISSMSFDSTMHPRMARKWGGGVLGNMEKEAELGATIIGDYIAQERLNPRKIALLGISYGADQSLLISKLAREGKVPFRLDAVQAHCPPVSMASALDILDRNFKSPPALTELGWKFYNLQRTKDGSVPRNFKEDWAQIAITRVFYMDLAEIVLQNDDNYGGAFEKMTGRARLIPKFEIEMGQKVECDKDRRKDYAAACSFGRYVKDFGQPFWEASGYHKDLMVAGDLKTLANECGDNAEIIVSRNDPLNESGAVQGLIGRNHRARVLVLPRGGHCGYFNSDWCKRKVQGIFGDK